MDHFEEGQERQAFYKNVHRPLKLWYLKKGESMQKLYGTFPTFWQVSKLPPVFRTQAFAHVATHVIRRFRACRI
jgi:hypothetical protein